jgi:hypothetical protein
MSSRLLSLASITFGAILFAGEEPATPPMAPTAQQVKLPKDKLSLSDALASIHKQTGILVRDGHGEKDVNVQVKVAQGTFWETLDSIADAADLQPYAFSGDGTLTLVPRQPGGKPQVSYAGPFRVSLLRLTMSQDFDTGNRSAAARLQILWEPTLRPFHLNERPTSINLQGNKDAAPTKIINNQIVTLAPLDGRIGHVCDLPLPVIDRANTQLVCLSGTLKATVPGSMASFSFPTLDKLMKQPVSQTQNEITCVVDNVTLAENKWTFQIHVGVPAGEKFESNLSWIVYNEMNLVSADNKQHLHPARFTIKKMGTTEAILVYTFVGSPAMPLGRPSDWHLTYLTPASIVSMAVPFSFANVPLP